jgi:hypothetical protein
VTSDWNSGRSSSEPISTAYHVHQLDPLPLHVAWEQISCIRGEFEESAVTQVSDVAIHRIHRIERLLYNVDSLRRHGLIAAIYIAKWLSKPTSDSNAFK